ncbi:MAG: hypothetical protein AB1508_17910 [Pseudomonadota bacterium]
MSLQAASGEKQATATAAADNQRLLSRIESMFSRDRLTAIGFVLALWFVIFFVLLGVHSYINNRAAEIVCWIAAFLLVLFNTTSITAMIRHYSHDKYHIYSVDIRHLDAGR